MSRGITNALAQGLRDNGRQSEAETLLREAGGYDADKIAVMVREFACGLRENGRAEEADQLLASLKVPGMTSGD
jgi:hypothetical protein